MHFFGERVLREQRTREAVLHEAIEDVRTTPPTADVERQVDEDWLEMFARHAETKTNAEVRTYFARVLAGEIRKPGSFSPETIDVLAKLSPQVGQLFQRLCSITADIPMIGLPVILTGPFGSAGSNGLAPIGFPYDLLCRLQDAGLVRSELNTTYTMPTLALQRIVIGGQALQFRIPTAISETEGSDVVERGLHGLFKQTPFKTVTLTAAGVELRRIVHMTPNETYIAKFVEWATKLGFEAE